MGPILKLTQWLFYFINNHLLNHETIKCKQCKGEMTSRKQYLALIPAYFDDEHEETAEYYINNITPISDESEIPTGRRDCCIHVFQCGNCGNKLISVVDFLKVRDKILVKGGDTYPYEHFRKHIENYFSHYNSEE